MIALHWNHFLLPLFAIIRMKGVFQAYAEQQQGPSISLVYTTLDGNMHLPFNWLLILSLMVSLMS